MYSSTTIGGTGTSSDVNIHSRTLNAMAKRHLIRTVGRIGNKQAYALRAGGWVIA